MDFDLRDWLLILGPIFVLGILVHGYWRMRQNRNNLKMGLDKSFLSENKEDDLLMLKAELPNGGARVRSVPEQAILDLEEQVPVLMDSVKGDSTRQESPDPTNRPDPINSHEPVNSHEPISSLDPIGSHEPISSLDPISSHEPVESPGPIYGQNNAESMPGNHVLSEPTGPEKFVVVSVLSTTDAFSGQALLQLLNQQNMVHGEMEIFHRQDLRGESIFSLANAVEPGTFDMDRFGDQSTPGVSLFMRVHELSDPVCAFNDMVDVAQTLAETLGGELRDETRSVMTSQTIAHAQQELIQYQHKHR